MKEININPKILYLATIIIFLISICFFSAIYPLGHDEIAFSNDTWAMVFDKLKDTFFNDAPRFMNLLCIIFMRFTAVWKICFSIINPFIQLFIIFGIFFVITGRKVNFKSTKDFYFFLLLTLIYLLLIPSPSNNLFWIAGTMNYSWAFVPSLILLCLFRKTIDGKELKNSVLNNFLMTFCGFATGMSNENTGPMMLGLTVLFLIYCKFKKIKIPKFYYFALAGIILGISAMFGSGASVSRLKSNSTFTYWQNLPLTTKIFSHLAPFNSFLNATFWLPIINLIVLIIVLYDKRKLIIKNKNFIYSFIFLSCSMILAAVLFMAPFVSIRTFYSSAVFLFISFGFLLLLLKDFYRLNFIKYISLMLFIAAIIVSPLCAFPYIYLYKQDSCRNQIISAAIKENKKEVFVNRLIVLKAPTHNWTIEYYDILWPWLGSKLNKKIKIIYPKSDTISEATEPI